MRTYFCYLIPRTDVSAYLKLRCALLLFICLAFQNISTGQIKCPGGLDSIQQVCIEVECNGYLTITWDAHPSMCYTFSTPSGIVIPDVSDGKVILSGSDISTNAPFYILESCNSLFSLDPCSPPSGSTTYVDFFKGIFPKVDSAGIWKFGRSGVFGNTKDSAIVFDPNSPVVTVDIIASSNLSVNTSSIIRPSGMGTMDAEYCIEASFTPGSLDSVHMEGENVSGTLSSGQLNNSSDHFEFCVDTNIGAGEYENQVIVFYGFCSDTVSVLTEVLPGSDEPTMACHSYINISISGSGSTITPEMMLPGQSAVGKISFIEGTMTNQVNCSDVGKTLKVVVLDTLSGQNCWGYVTISDESVFTAMAEDTMVNCLSNMASLTAEALVTISDNCLTLEDLDVSFADEFADKGCDHGDTLKVIHRTWILKDASGNIVNAKSDIVIKKIDFDSIVFPPDTVIYCPNTSFDVEFTGDVNVNKDTLAKYCKLLVAFSDKEIPTGCSGMRKVRRDWLAIDWCNNNVRDTSQYITLIDTVPPVITCPRGDISGISEIHTTLDMCGADFVFPPFSAIDSCSEDDSIRYDIRVNKIFVTGQTSAFMGIGQNIIEYIAEDDCGNKSSCMDTVWVIDKTGPIISSTTKIQVALTGSGATLIPLALMHGALDIRDNCALDSTFIRRKTSRCGIPSDTMFGQSISICCEDSDTIVVVEIMATDTSGNPGYGEINIDVKDPILPLIECRNTTIYVNSDHFYEITDASIFIKSFSDNCPSKLSFELSRDTFFGNGPMNLDSVIIVLSDADGSSECKSNVTVLDTFPPMKTNGLLAGRVLDPFEKGLRGMSVTLLFAQNELESQKTDGKGEFEFSTTDISEDYSVMLDGFGSEMNGVSSLDLYLIQKHILGIDPLDNAYLELAADIDRSGNISVVDILHLQNAILDHREHLELPWLFMNDNVSASDIVYRSNQAVPLSLNNLTYRGIKMGDVSGNIYDETQGRRLENSNILIDNISLEKGELYELPVYLLVSDGLVSFEAVLDLIHMFDLSFVPRQFEHFQVEYSLTEERISILGYGDTDGSGKIEIGTIRFSSNLNGQISSIIKDSDQYPSAGKLYNKFYEEYDLDLGWIETSVKTMAALDQYVHIFPNPAINRVNFKLEVDPAEITSFKIHDITGKEIIDFSQNDLINFSIPTSIFQTSGSYIVTIESKHGVQNDILLINKK